MAARRRAGGHHAVPRRTARGAGRRVGAGRRELVARGLPRAGSSASTDTLFVPASRALANSLGFAALAACIAVVVGGLASVVIASRPGRATRAMDTLLMLPLGTSAVTVGFGFLVALDRWPLDLRAKTILVPIAQAVVAIPFVIRAVVPALRSIDPRLRDAAAVLGARPARVARGGSPDRAAGVHGRLRLRGRGIARGVRRDPVRRPSRLADHSDRDLALPRAARAR